LDWSPVSSLSVCSSSSGSLLIRRSLLLTMASLFRNGVCLTSLSEVFLSLPASHPVQILRYTSGKALRLKRPSKQQKAIKVLSHHKVSLNPVMFIGTRKMHEVQDLRTHSHCRKLSRLGFSKIPCRIITYAPLLTLFTSGLLWSPQHNTLYLHTNL